MDFYREVYTGADLKPLIEVVDGFAQWFDPKASYELASWSSIVIGLDSCFGKSWKALEISVIGSAIRNQAERGKGGRYLFDEKVPMPVRVRYAKGQSGNLKYWQDQLAHAKCRLDHGAWCLTAGVWTDISTFISLASEFESELAYLSEYDKEVLLDAVLRGNYYAFNKSRLKQIPSLASFSNHMLALLACRLENHDEIILKLLDEVANPVQASMCLDWLVGARARTMSPSQLLGHIKAMHMAGGRLAREPEIRGSAAWRNEIIDRVLEDPWDFPSPLVAAATQMGLRRKKRFVPVLSVASEQNWFQGESGEALF